MSCENQMRNLTKIVHMDLQIKKLGTFSKETIWQFEIVCMKCLWHHK